MEYTFYEYFLMSILTAFAINFVRCLWIGYKESKLEQAAKQRLQQRAKSKLYLRSGGKYGKS